MKEKFNNFIHSKLFIIILILVLIASTVLVGTYAWFTWSNPSDQNTLFTMSIGGVVDVTFTEGNTITGTLDPVYNYYDGLSKTFEANNKAGYNVNCEVSFDITTIDSELISEDVKYALVVNDEIIAEGDFSSASNGNSIVLANNVVVNSGINNFNIYFYIDGNVENNVNMMNKNLSGSIIFELLTSYTDFEYYLGSEYPVVSLKVPGYVSDDETGDSVLSTITLPTTISLSENEILLTKYNSTLGDVVVPDTFFINNMPYNVVLLSYVYNYYDDCTDVAGGTFVGNTDIKSVVLGENIRVVFLDAGCSTGSFLYEDGFNNNSAAWLFSYCSNLVNVPVIPNSVTNMDFTFQGCTNLTGDIKINTTELSSIYNIFDRTSKLITVSVPDGSNTFNTFDTVTLPSNVTLVTH